MKNFQQLLQLEEEVLVTNREVLECLICFQKVPPGQGVLLRECLHSFCRYPPIRDHPQHIGDPT